MGGSQAKVAVLLASACALTVIFCLAIPYYVIRPFRPQGTQEMAVALTVRHFAPWISGICAAIALLSVIWALRAKHGSLGRISRISTVVLALVTVAGAVLTHINVFEVMFHPYDEPAFAAAAEGKIDSDDKLLAVSLGSESHAYPIRTMGYHHIVNDSVDGVPIAVTYCTLCHTGLVWKRTLDGRTLHFRLAGINNENALIRDEETSTIWQQSTGQAIFGPLKGRALELVRSDELTFALWKKEHPLGLILKPDARYADDYDPKDWEKHVEKRQAVIDTSKSGIPQHKLMLGVLAAGQPKAYPVDLLLAEKLVQDGAGSEPLLLLVGPDQASIRVFRARLSGEPGPLTFVRTPEKDSAGENVMVDQQSGSVWNFQGCAVKGSQTGKCLAQVDANKDYWFDWFNHHPETGVYHD